MIKETPALPALPPFEGFAHRLRRVRTERGLTQRDLAKRIKKHYSEVSSYETGTHPGFWNLCELARALDVSLDWLCCLTDVYRPLNHRNAE